jgi:hypothetical protein
VRPHSRESLHLHFWSYSLFKWCWTCLIARQLDNLHTCQSLLVAVFKHRCQVLEALINGSLFSEIFKLFLVLVTFSSHLWKPKRFIRLWIVGHLVNYKLRLGPIPLIGGVKVDYRAKFLLLGLIRLWNQAHFILWKLTLSVRFINTDDADATQIKIPFPLLTRLVLHIHQLVGWPHVRCEYSASRAVTTTRSKVILWVIVDVEIHSGWTFLAYRTHLDRARPSHFFRFNAGLIR